MNEQELVSHIEELGLSNKEARVYVASLMVGPSPVQRIADKSGIKRVTTYVILESLIGLGLVSQSIKGKKTYFMAEDPINLNRLLDKREDELKDQKANFKHILPALNSLKTIPRDSPNMMFYDTTEGIRLLYDSFYTNVGRNHSIVYEIANADQVNHFFKDLGLGQHNPARLKSGIRSVFLYTSQRGPIYQSTDEISDRESRYVEPSKYPLTGTLSILGDSVVILSLTGDQPVGISIHSKAIAESMKAIFDMAWLQAERNN